jgi:hypothetical protein
MLKYAAPKKWTHHCEVCDYGCNKKFLMTQHKKTKKHEMLTNAHLAAPTSINNMCMPSLISCRCGRKYKHIQSYNRHLKICDKLDGGKPDSNNNAIILLSTLSEQYKNIVTENEEMRRIVKELLPRIGNTTINNQFNIQMFLNEECKDALNMTEFIDSLQLDHKDIDSAREHGYALGITNIFIRGLKALDLNKRPIHCSDLKQEILYVKDYGVWEKDDVDKSNIKKAITSVSKKQFNSVKNWEEKHPDWQKCEQSMLEYCEIIQQLTSPNKDDDVNKIIKGISREIVINK